MRKIKFTKVVASGNDFIIIGGAGKSPVRSGGALAQIMCDRKYGIGADGLLVLEKSKVADIKMRYFNTDGSEAEMCGNGARCIALYIASRPQTTDRRPKRIKIETKAGIIEAQTDREDVRIKLTDPKNIRLNIPIKINNRTLKVSFINTGVPHTVIFVEGLDKLDVLSLGSLIRYHGTFAPEGTNVDFVEVLNNNSISVRTYERGVEDETLACGTGAVAASLVFSFCLRRTTYRIISVHTKSKEVLKVYFEKTGNTFQDIWLEGKAGIVYKGEYRV